MKLYLIQHGQAASPDVDPQRPLTEEGVRDVRKVAAFIKPLKLRVDCVWHSRKKRAIQTAEILAEVVSADEGRVERDGLAPNDDVAAVKDEIVFAQQDVMIVGHLPFVSKLASLLLTGDESAGVVAFKQGGIVVLSSSEDNHWQVDWMVIPDLII